VIALHHAGDKNLRTIAGTGTHPANEGIPMQAIKSAINK
jgi:hypothetical protein